MRGGEGQSFLQRCHGVEAWQGGGKSQCMWGIGSGHILQSQPLKLDLKKKKEFCLVKINSPKFSDCVKLTQTLSSISACLEPPNH